MKVYKLSLVAALALSANAFAFDITQHDIKISGHVKLWYQTMDHQGVANEKGMFQFQDDGTVGSRNEWGNVSAQIKMTGTANDHLSYGATINGVTSMGFNGHITSAETTRSNDVDGVGVETGREQIPFWFHEIFADYKTGATNIKLGRQELDTPFAFTEKWNATSNSFEALKVTNRDLKDTELKFAWISKGNGANERFRAAPQVFGAMNTFNNYMSYYRPDGTTVANPGGMLLAGAKNNSIKNIPLQAWYYNTPDVMQAFWLQADAKGGQLGPIKNAALQVIGAGIGTNGTLKRMLQNGYNSTQTKTDDTYAAAAKVSASISRLSTFAAFSQTSKGNLPVANTATNYKKTKLPTQSIFSDGMVAAQPGTTSVLVGASTKLTDVTGLKVTYAHYDIGRNEGYYQPNAAVGGPASFGWIANMQQKDLKLNEVDVVLTTKFKDINLACMYIFVDRTYVPGTGLFATSSARYGDAENHIVRIVATLNF